MTSRFHNTCHATWSQINTLYHLNKVAGVHRHNPVVRSKIRLSLGSSREFSLVTLFDNTEMSEMDRTLKPAEAEDISMKASSFWSTAAACWFSTLEAKFKLNKISSQTAIFSHLTQSLTADIAQEVSGVLLAPMSETPGDPGQDPSGTLPP